MAVHQISPRAAATTACWLSIAAALMMLGLHLKQSNGPLQELWCVGSPCRARGVPATILQQNSKDRKDRKRRRFDKMALAQLYDTCNRYPQSGGQHDTFMARNARVLENGQDRTRLR